MLHLQKPGKEILVISNFSFHSPLFPFPQYFLLFSLIDLLLIIHLSSTEDLWLEVNGTKYVKENSVFCHENFMIISWANMGGKLKFAIFYLYNTHGICITGNFKDHRELTHLKYFSLKKKTVDRILSKQYLLFFPQ